ncbi:hypothetical protein [Providencia stuartii]|uniref:hypothetical protein n=1 Tax=Providencia stuartii TaxID=588 RepID=UPI00146C9292|nr:hypothetical protein [Providencia stuartii]MDT1066776.1 hypothetical protein [Providencia stuartii]NMT47702.1 hypothetical protein [Providencia stuartii]NPD43306.1 hypothetical protein [Providencia stuartii]NPD96594.1 hypothetical protein [Providencia stuartii]UQZ11347.1 hypothetical protein M8G38_16505 [Providencia stuartii]
MDKSRQQFEEWRSKNKSSTINLFDVWQASRESLINNLEPVGYITPVSGLLLRRKQKSFIYPEKTETNIPLYRLD